MNNVHGIIYAYHGFSQLGALCTHRTGASLPFCGRYRLIDFTLSSMMNAGIHDVGVIMQRGYQSLMDHLGSGRTWDMSRRTDGLKLLPPYALPDSDMGFYEGCMEALGAVQSYLHEIKQKYVVLGRGDLCANVDIAKAVEQHISSGADVTAVCCRGRLPYIHHRFIPGENGMAEQLLCQQVSGSQGVASLEIYVMEKDTLLRLVQWCSERSRLHFHRDAMYHLMGEGGKVGIYMHEGYARHIISVDGYYQANMDMLDSEKRAGLFTEDRRITTRERMDVSTYYGDMATVKHSLVADGCVIEGNVENCVIFCGVKVSAGSTLKNCIVMNDTVIGERAELECIICDKNVDIPPYVTLNGNSHFPLVIPRDSKL